MDNDILIFAAIFIVAISAICGGVVMAAFHRISSASSAQMRRHKLGYHAAGHRAYKDVL